MCASTDPKAIVLVIDDAAERAKRENEAAEAFKKMAAEMECTITSSDYVNPIEKIDGRRIRGDQEPWYARFDHRRRKWK